MRERPIAPMVLPACLAPMVSDRAWFRDTVGEAGCAVYRLHGAGGDLYLKHGAGALAGDVTDEMVRLRWLANHVPVPAVRHFVTTPDEAWLLTEALPGRTAWQMLEADPAGRGAVVDALALFLRGLHAIPLAACPFDSDHTRRMRQARARLDAGLVDTEDFGDAHDGWTGEQVWDEMIGLLPLAPDPVVTHGDFSLDNILIADGTVSGCIDVARAGAADRYQDLAILWDCLSEFDAGLPLRMLAVYGIERLDMAKLRFHLALDEMF